MQIEQKDVFHFKKKYKDSERVVCLSCARKKNSEKHRHSPHQYHVISCDEFSIAKSSTNNKENMKVLWHLPGLTTSPGWDFIRSCLPSKWVKTKWKPQSASVRDRVCSTNRSSPFLLNLGWSFCWRTKTMSPVTVSGCT